MPPQHSSDEGGRTVITQFYCEHCEVRTGIEATNKEVSDVKEDVSDLKVKYDRGTLGLIAILVAVIGNLLLYIFNTPSKNDIAVAVLDAIKNGVQR